MSAIPDLARMGAGFTRPGAASQHVFRATLEAMAHPGRTVAVAQSAELPTGLGAAAGAVLLALLDQDTRFWTPPTGHAEAIAAYLRFHTGCVLAASGAQADFVHARDAREMPSLADFACGSELFPERSTTLVVEVERLAGRGWTLRGPGVESTAQMAAAIPGPRFLAQWRSQRARFPRGIDLILACGENITALPRTIDIDEE